MKNFKKIVFLGIQYIDYLVYPSKKNANLMTSIPSTIVKREGSVLGVAKSAKKYFPKNFLQALFVPIVGKDYKIDNINSNISPIIINDENTSSAILINDIKYGKSASFVDFTLNYFENLSNLISDKILEINSSERLIHILYADNMKIDKRFISQLNKSDEISIDFCRSNASVIFSDANLCTCLKKLINKAKYIFLSDHEDDKYHSFVLEYKKDDSIFIFHKPDLVKIYFQEEEFVIENQFFDKNLKSEVGLGDLFSFLFLSKIIFYKEVKLKNLQDVISDIQKEIWLILKNNIN